MIIFPKFIPINPKFMGTGLAGIFSACPVYAKKAGLKYFCGFWNCTMESLRLLRGPCDRVRRKKLRKQKKSGAHKKNPKQEFIKKKSQTP
jgi:hypothetical protein